MTRRLLPLLLLLACNKDADDTAVDVPDEALAISISAPGDGSFVDASTVNVEGEAKGTGASFLLNTDDLVPADGAYAMASDHAASVWPESPLWPVLAHGEDDEGWLRDRITLVKGPSAPAGDPIPNALVLRVTDNLIDSVEPVIEEELLNLDLESQLVTGAPVASGAGSDLYVDAASVGSLEMGELDFQSQGLAWSFTIHDISADIRAEIIFLGTEDGTVAADQIDISGFMTFGANTFGELTVTPHQTTVNITGLAVEGFESSLVDSLINTFLSDFIGQQVETLLVEQMEELLTFQEEIRELSLGGVTLFNDFTSASHDDTGANIYAQTTVMTEDGALTTARLSNPNSPAAPTTMTVDGANYGAALMLDDDALSGLGVGLYEGGLLEQTIDSESAPIALTTTTLGGFVEAFEQLPAGLDVTIVTAPTLGFPASPSTGAPEAARLNVGGMGLDFMVDVDGSGTPVSQMTVVVDVIASLQGSDNLIDFELAEINATMTQTLLDVDDPTETEEALAGMFGFLLPGLLGDALTGGIGGAEGGFLDGIEYVDSGPKGSAGDYAALYFNLDVAVLLPEEEPPPAR